MAAGLKKTLFTAKSCVSFNVTDGAKTVLVDVKNQSQWQLTLKKTDEIFNIYRDDHKGCLQSGGERGRISQGVVRPHALKFWNDFNQGKDPPSRMTPVNAGGMSGFGNRPRMAFEYVLKVGDPVSVTGTLRQVNGSLVLVADSASNITNAVSMKFWSQLEPAAVAPVEPQVLQMSPFTHRPSQQPTLLHRHDLQKPASHCDSAATSDMLLK